MHDFAYHRAASIDEAAALMKKSASENGDAALLAGGQTLIPTLKQRLAAPSDLIDIGSIADLRSLRMEGDHLIIGAATTHAQVAMSESVKKFCPALAHLAGMIGDPSVRHRGTIGGSLANNDPAADYPAACLALNASITTQKRTISAENFFTGLFETALEDDEIITEISFPKPARAAYVKFPQPASRYALAGVFYADINGAPQIAITGSGENGVFRSPDAESAIQKNNAPNAADDVKISTDGLMEDIHADAVWRAHLIKIMIKRAIAAAAAAA